MLARWHISSAIMGLMPVRWLYRAFWTDMEEELTAWRKVSWVTVSGFSLATVWGMK